MLPHGGRQVLLLKAARNRAVAHIVPIRERSALRIRKPAAESPRPNQVPLPKSATHQFDVVELLLQERQSHR
jgi:antitoxin (DNA-binding transcriptional repressor) of toxin-antitoxin stability system